MKESRRNLVLQESKGSRMLRGEGTGKSIKEGEGKRKRDKGDVIEVSRERGSQWIYLYFHSNVILEETPSSCEVVKTGTAGSLLGGPGCCQAALLVRYILEYTMPQQVCAIRGEISKIAGGCQFFSKWCCPVFFSLSNCVEIYSKMHHLYRNIFKGPVIFTLLLLFVTRQGAEG